MSGLAILLVLASTLLHTAWNGALKSTDSKRCFNAWLLTWSLLITLPGGILALSRGATMGWDALACALGSSLLWLVYYEGLARAYDGGDLSAMHPVARGSTPMIAAMIGLTHGELPTAAGWLGILAITVAVWLIGGAPTRLAGWRQPQFAAALLVGAVGAGYSTLDTFGVRHCDVQLYQVVEYTLSATWLMAYTVRREGWAPVRDYGRSTWRLMILVALGGWGSYMLVLYAFRLAPTSYVVALRATAVVWSVLYGGLVLREGAMRRRLIYAGLMVLGVVLLKVWGSA